MMSQPFSALPAGSGSEIDKGTGMKVVILCGGQGTRIRDVSEALPKPMLPLGEMPILWHIMKSYATAGHTDFILCLGYQGRVIRDFFFNYRAYSGDATVTIGKDTAIEYHGGALDPEWRVTLVDTGLDTMTGARVRRVRKYLDGEENFMLTYGDGLGDIDFDALLDFHKAHGKVMSITGVRPPGRFGELESDDSGLISEFNEKPQTGGGRISGGFFVCKQELFDYLDNRDDLVLEEDPFTALVRDQQIMVYKHNRFWQCMDTPRDYKYLNSLWISGDAPWQNSK